MCNSQGLSEPAPSVTNPPPPPALFFSLFPASRLTRVEFLPKLFWTVHTITKKEKKKIQTEPLHTPFTTSIPPKTECDCLYGGVIKNGRTCYPLTLCSVPALVHVQVHILGDHQSVQLRNTTTTTWIPPKMERGCLHGGVIENGRTRNSLTLCSVPVQVWVHIAGDPQCSAVECYNTNCLNGVSSLVFSW